MKRLQSVLCLILLLFLVTPAFSQTKGMRIIDPRTKEARIVKVYENSYAVCIGIDEYTHWPQLSYAVSDAVAMKKKLLEHGFTEVKLITNEDATQDGILSAIAWLGEVAGKEDRVVIYFSGHGETKKSRRRQTGYIIPVDCPKKDYYVNAISMGKIREATYEIKAKHILYIMDSCYSGIALIAPRADEEFMIEMTKDPCVYMITAGKAGEQALEVSGYGIFTHYILRGLDGEADYDKNGVISGTELGLYSRKWVSHEARQRGKTQTPQFGRIDGEGEIVFLAQVEGLTAIQELESTTTLVVESKPADASVYVDGREVGKTPCTVEIDTGIEGEREVTVAVSKDEYGTKRAKIKLAAGKQASWTDIHLDKLPTTQRTSPEPVAGKGSTAAMPQEYSERAKWILEKSHQKYNDLLRKDGQAVKSIAVKAKVSVNSRERIPIGVFGSMPVNIDTTVELYAELPYRWYLDISSDLGNAKITVAGQEEMMATIFPSTRRFTSIKAPAKSPKEVQDQIEKLRELAVITYEGTQIMNAGKAHKIMIRPDFDEIGTLMVCVLDGKWALVGLEFRNPKKGSVVIEFEKLELNVDIPDGKFVPGRP